jgi:hypothetical protein
MTFKQTSLVVSLSAALSFGAPRLAVASSPESEAPPASSETKVKIALVVDAAAIDDEFRHQLEVITTRQLQPALEEAGYEVTDGFVDLALQVRYTPVEAGQFRDHGIHFEVIKGKSVEPAIQWVLCNACGQVRLEELLTETTPQLIEALNKATETPSTQTPEGHHNDDPNGSNNDSQPVELPKPIGPMGGVGIGVAAVGLGVLIWGGVELSRGVVIDDRGNEQRSLVDHRPRGNALLGVGAASLVVGAVLLGVDLGLRSKQRKQARSKTAVAPFFTPQSVGIGVAGQF